MDTSTVIQIATVVGSALSAFLAGHYHILLSSKVPAAPDAKPAPAPVVVPVAPAPDVIAPIGKGGILQVLSIFLTAISQHPSGTDAIKQDAALAAIKAIQPLLVAGVSSPVA